MNERLKQVRKSLKLSQEFVAKQLGMTRTTIVAIEAGTRKVTTDELTMFSNLYGVTTDKLLYGDVSEDSEVKAENEDMVLDIADEWYNERSFEDVTIVEMNKE